ncbi:hypothetical protein TrVFT333_006092 [Trichoderma virens FT-333]|nr:hypothetical protein TrVFT333_006092 [Trichoderma virens FT-333]
MSSAQSASNGSASSASQEQHLPFLQLPLDLTIAIVSRLPRHNQIVVSQTCHALRDSLCKYILREQNHLPERLPRRQRQEFLHLIARDHPDKWVCSACLELHQANDQDTPRRPWSENCPFGESEAIDLTSHRNHGFQLSHRHVQLTIKHTRLADSITLNTTHLQKLLAPYDSIIDGQFVKGWYLAYPKVVEGRYLLQSVRDFQKVMGRMLPQYLDKITICLHQTFRARDIIPPGQLSRDTTSQDERRYALQVAVETAFKSPGEGISSLCELCSTDFSVNASLQGVVVRVWQDFGPEGTPQDPYWQSHVSLVFSKSTPCRIAGSIQEMYGE